jgi:hypothetical protein
MESLKKQYQAFFPSSQYCLVSNSRKSSRIEQRMILIPGCIWKLILEYVNQDHLIQLLSQTCRTLRIHLVQEEFWKSLMISFNYPDDILDEGYSIMPNRTIPSLWRELYALDRQKMAWFIRYRANSNQLLKFLDVRTCR